MFTYETKYYLNHYLKSESRAHLPSQVFSVGGASVVYVCVYLLNFVFPGNHGDLSLFSLSMCAVQAIQQQMCVAHSLPVSYR